MPFQNRIDIHLVPHMQNALERGQAFEKNIQKSRLELASPAAFQHLQNFIITEAAPVNPVRPQGVIHVYQAYDTSFQRNFFTLQFMGLAGAIPVFMMPEGYAFRHLDYIAAGVGQDFTAYGRVLLNDQPLVCGKGPRFEQYGV